jgi:nucleoside-diphosphate-sugar epimerase
MSGSPRLSGPAAALLPGRPERIVVTGASGWIGLASLELLYNTLGPRAFAERVFAFGSSARSLDFGAGTIQQRPLAAILSLPPAPTLVLHLAFVTKDKASAMDEGEYRRLNRSIGRAVLEALDLIGATAVFVASSGAAGYADDPAAPHDLRLYGALKKADEDMFAAWAEERARRAVIARIFALSGPHINKHENYALASFIADALAGRPVAIRADFPVYRSYVAVRELVALVFAAMLDEGPAVVRFSTGGERLEMQQVAETVAEVLGPVAVARPPLRNDRTDEYVGDDAAYQRLLSRYGIAHLPFGAQVAETAAAFASEAPSKKRNSHA